LPAWLLEGLEKAEKEKRQNEEKNKKLAEQELEEQRREERRKEKGLGKFVSFHEYSIAFIHLFRIPTVKMKGRRR
jgi:hypothetical protein